jgi:hypothetical protein
MFHLVHGDQWPTGHDHKQIHSDPFISDRDRGWAEVHYTRIKL